MHSPSQIESRDAFEHQPDPVFATGDLQGARLFFQSKKVAPSAAGLLPTIKAKLSFVGELLRAPKKVRCIGK